MIDWLDISLHTLLLIWIMCLPCLLGGVVYLYERENKQHEDRNRGDAPLSAQSQREWLWPAVAVSVMWAGVPAYFWFTA